MGKKEQRQHNVKMSHVSLTVNMLFMKQDWVERIMVSFSTDAPTLTSFALIINLHSPLFLRLCRNSSNILDVIHGSQPITIQ